MHSGVVMHMQLQSIESGQSMITLCSTTACMHIIIHFCCCCGAVRSAINYPIIVVLIATELSSPANQC